MARCGKRVKLFLRYIGARNRSRPIAWASFAIADSTPRADSGHGQPDESALPIVVALKTSKALAVLDYVEMHPSERVGAEIRGVLESAKDRTRKARGVAELIRDTGSYSWVGIYMVDGDQVAALGWTGPEPPSHPRFSAARACAVRRYTPAPPWSLLT